MVHDFILIKEIIFVEDATHNQDDGSSHQDNKSKKGGES